MADFLMWVTFAQDFFIVHHFDRQKKNHSNTLTWIQIDVLFGQGHFFFLQFYLKVKRGSFSNFKFVIILWL